GRITVPVLAGKLWFTSPSLYKPLSSDIDLPTTAEQATDALAYMFAPFVTNLRDKGTDAWRHDLLEETGPRFEVALLTALARLGIPMLFGGRFTADNQQGGMQTPGFNLVALRPPHHYMQPHAVAISTKGTANFPKGTAINNILRSAETLQQALPGWVVFGLIICQAPASLLSQFTGRTDVKVWGRTELETLLAADRPEAIARLLWKPPWLTDKLAYQYYLM